MNDQPPLMPKQAIEEFKHIYKQDYAKDISDAETLELGEMKRPREPLNPITHLPRECTPSQLRQFLGATMVIIDTLETLNNSQPKPPTIRNVNAQLNK